MIEAFVGNVIEEQKSRSRNSEILCAKQKSSIHTMCAVSLVDPSTSRGRIASPHENANRIIKNEVHHQEYDLQSSSWNITVGSKVGFVF